MRIIVLLCNCKGLCKSFSESDFNTVPFQIESDLDVSYVALHPQTCGQGGNAFLADIMKTAGKDTYIVSAACAPEAQDKLFKKVMRLTGFPSDRFIPVDIRMTNNDGVIERIREKVAGLLERENAGSESVAADVR